MIRHESELESERTRILVVDDDDGVRRAFLRILEPMQCELFEAPGADAALDLLHRIGAVDMVLSDLQMPERDGYSLLIELRKRYPDTAVMMLTGNTDIGAAVDCLTQGAVDYLSKPVSSQELRTRVTRALENRRTSLEYRALRSQYQTDLERQVRELGSKNQQMFLSQVQMAVTMLEAKDPYTRGHSHRVAQYAVATGRIFGLPNRIIEQLRLGGELHDIGKIGTRDAVLHKPGPLTDEEFAEIRLHTIAGEEMLDPLRTEHPEVLNIVRWHHERMDGNGFPDRLRGIDIPLTARIVAAVDAFDAMTTTRSYRSHLDPDIAMTELARCKGTQFDPEVIDAFARAVPDPSTFALFQQ